MPTSRQTRRVWNPWPVAIAVFFGGFLLWTIGFIAFSVSRGTELVRPDYYAQEVRYQEQLDRITRTRELAAPVQLRYDAERRQLVLALPREHAGHEMLGTVQFYRPSAAGQDRRIALVPDAAGCQTIDARDLVSGLWRVRVAWRVGQQEYFSDERLVIPRPGS